MHVKAEGEEADKELAQVLDNSIAWGGFVASSTNLRYQLVNGFEERALAGNCPLTLHTNVKNNWHSGWGFPSCKLVIRIVCQAEDCPVLDIPLLC